MSLPPVPQTSSWNHANPHADAPLSITLAHRSRYMHLRAAGPNRATDDLHGGETRSGRDAHVFHAVRDLIEGDAGPQGGLDPFASAEHHPLKCLAIGGMHVFRLPPRRPCLFASWGKERESVVGRQVDIDRVRALNSLSHIPGPASQPLGRFLGPPAGSSAWQWLSAAVSSSP